MLESLHIYNTALCFLGALDRGDLQRFRVLLEQLIGHIRNFSLGLGRVGGMLQANGDDHLVLPERNGVDDRGLDLFRHDSVGVLDHPDLGTCLHGDHTGQIQIIQLLLEAVAHFGIVPGRLGILLQSGPLGLFLQCLKLSLPGLFELSLAGQDVHGQFLEIIEVELIHLIQDRHILHQLDLMLLKLIGNSRNVGLDLRVFGLHVVELVGALLKESQKTFFFFLLVQAL